MYVSLGEEGLFHGTRVGYDFVKAKTIEVVNANGAGDAFMAGLVYADFMGYDSKTKIKFAMSSSVAALTSYETINPDMSDTYVKSIIEDVYNDL